MKFEYPKGATPLDRNEIEGLIPKYISTQGELNEAEQENILNGELWVLNGKHKEILSETFVRKVHKKMFSEVWKWAGDFRKSDKNLGVAWPHISTELHKLLKDTSYWIENKTYPWDELGARFHHRLVFIHCFPNGNGRHARTMTQVLLTANGQKAFTWGTSRGSSARDEYLLALREGDQKDFERLKNFVRS